jgi:hypothetical protein
MRAQSNVERGGQHRDAVLAALGLAHDELTALERNVLDPQSQRLHETQAAAVEQARDQPWSPLQLRQQCVRVGATQHHGQPLRAGRTSDVGEPRQLDLEHVTVKKQQCLKRLILRGGANLAAHGKEG